MKRSDADTMDTGEICVSRIVVMSGIRPAGRTTDHRVRGRNNHGILYIWNGEARFSEEGAPVICAKAGDLVSLPQGIRYSMQYTAQSTTYVLVNMDMTTPEGEAASVSDDIRILANDAGDRRFANVMAKLEMCSASENRAANFRRTELVYRLLSMLFEETAALELRDSRYANIIPGVLLLQQTYLESIPISEFAAACKISVSSFRGLFTEQYGMSPVQYRARLRINRARMLLVEGSCSVSEAAYASGFENIGYFCRYYKKVTGETPGETRQRSL